MTWNDTNGETWLCDDCGFEGSPDCFDPNKRSDALTCRQCGGDAHEVIGYLF